MFAAQIPAAEFGAASGGAGLDRGRRRQEIGGGRDAGQGQDRDASQSKGLYTGPWRVSLRSARARGARVVR